MPTKDSKDFFDSLSGTAPVLGVIEWTSAPKAQRAASRPITEAELVWHTNALALTKKRLLAIIRQYKDAAIKTVPTRSPFAIVSATPQAWGNLRAAIPDNVAVRPYGFVFVAYQAPSQPQ